MMRQIQLSKEQLDKFYSDYRKKITPELERMRKRDIEAYAKAKDFVCD